MTVRDLNNVGADMVYDSLGRNTQRTDTFGDVTKTDYDRAGNAVKQTDAKQRAKTFWSFVYENSSISHADVRPKDGRSLLVGHRDFDDGIWDFLT